MAGQAVTLPFPVGAFLRIGSAGTIEAAPAIHDWGWALAAGRTIVNNTPLCAATLVEHLSWYPGGDR
jgi:hypothetical protein